MAHECTGSNASLQVWPDLVCLRIIAKKTTNKDYLFSQINKNMSGNPGAQDKLT